MLVCGLWPPACTPPPYTPWCSTYVDDSFVYVFGALCSAVYHYM